MADDTNGSFTLSADDKCWDIFETPEADTATIEYNYVQVRPTTAVATDPTNTRYEITMDQASAWCRPARSYILVKGKIVKAADGTGFADADLVSHKNTGFFTQGEYLVNNNLLDDHRQHMGQAFHVRNLVDLPKDYMETAGTNMGWSCDTGAGGTDIAPVTVASSQVLTAAPSTFAVTGTVAAAVTYSAKVNPAFNEGFYRRRLDQRDASGNTLEFQYAIPINRLFSYWRWVDKVATGYEHQIILHRQSDNDIIQRTGASAGTVVITDLIWMMPFAKVDLAVEAMLWQSIASGKAVTSEFEKLTVYRSSENTDSNDNPVFKILTTSEKITRILIALQPKNVNNSQTSNTAIYKHYNGTKYTLRMGDQILPKDNIKVDWSKKQVSRLWRDLLKTFDRDQDYHGGLAFGYQDFINLYPLIAFDFRDNRSMNPTAAGSTVSVEFEAEITPVATEQYYIYAYVFSERQTLISTTEKKVLFSMK